MDEPKIRANAKIDFLEITGKFMSAIYGIELGKGEDKIRAKTLCDNKMGKIYLFYGATGIVFKRVCP